MHLSLTVAVVVLPPPWMVMVLPHMGLPLDWEPMRPTAMATMLALWSWPLSSSPQEPRPMV